MTHTWHGQIDRWTQPFIANDISVIFSDISRIYSGPVIPLLLRDALSAVRWASPRYYHLHYNQYLLITFSPPRRPLWSQAWLIRADRKHKKCFIFAIRLLTCLSDAESLNLLIFFTSTLTETLSPQIEASELILGILKAGEYELAAAIKCDHFWSFQQYAYKNWKICNPVVCGLFCWLTLSSKTWALSLSFV